MEKPESGTGTGTGTLKIETRVNWETLKPVPDARVEIKFKMASSVIIVLRNFQRSDRDTKDVLTARKSLLWLFSTRMCSTLSNMLTHHA